MKTKIIYISGTEVFDMREIRAAFDEVRSALGLAKDTILFGVPVDADDALANTNTIEQSASVSAVAVVEEPEIPVIESEEKAIEIVAEEVVTTPAKKTRKRAVKEEVVPVVEAVETIEPVIEESPVIESVGEEKVEDTIPEVEEAPIEEEPIIPILSILASNVEDEVAAQDAEQEPEVAIAEETPAVVAETTEAVVDAIEETTEPIENADAMQVSVGDIISNEAPVAEKEKTLEELLESMTPLREEVETPATAEDTIEPEQDFDVVPDMDPDTDATLAQLANEFAAAQDKIVSIEKPESQGKIGKLKNILPFKKAKRDDSSLMGDLFGWAGIAANDEDFSIPGFFTNAASKK